LQPTDHLFTEWLAGARLPDALRVVQLVKAELSRRGIVLRWTISQVEIDGQAGERGPKT
jgi:hypothetical protein